MLSRVANGGALRATVRRCAQSGRVWAATALRAASTAATGVSETLGTGSVAAGTGPDENYVSLVPDTCCGTVPLHARQLVLLTPEPPSAWPSKPESVKGSLPWRYARLLQSASSSLGAGSPLGGSPEPPAASRKGGACGLGALAPSEDAELAALPDDDDEGEPQGAGPGEAATGSVSDPTEGGMPPVKLLQAHMRGAGEYDPRFAFADGSAAYTTQDRHAVLVFPEAVLVSGLVAGDAAAVVTALRTPGPNIREAVAASLAALGSEAKVEPAPGLHFMVCAHSRRDKRCGDNGTTVLSWLRKWRADYLRDSAAKRSTWHQPAATTGRASRASRGGWGSAASARAGDARVPVPRAVHPVKVPHGSARGLPDRLYRVAAREAIHVWPVSHVGMHRMAANVLVNPPGDWFAHMHEEADARALFEHAVELGLAAIPPDADSLHPLRTSHRGSLAPMGLAGVAWDAADGDDSGAGAPVDSTEADRRAGAWTDSLYSGTTVAEMVKPVARWWRGRMGLSKEQQQRIYLEIDPNADLGHAKLSAKLMGGSDRH